MIIQLFKINKRRVIELIKILTKEMLWRMKEGRENAVAEILSYKSKGESR